MASKKIIIPKGTIGPNETVVIDIPGTYSQNSTILARDFGPTPARGRNRTPVAGPPSNGVRRRLTYSTESEDSIRRPSGRYRAPVAGPPYNAVRRRLNYSTESEDSLRQARAMTPRRAQSTSSLSRNDGNWFMPQFASTPVGNSSFGSHRSNLSNSGLMRGSSSSLGLMNSRQMRSSFGPGSQRGTNSLGLMNSSQMNSTFGSPSLGLMRPSQMHSSFGPGSQRGTDSLGLMNSSQMNSTFGSPSLGLMRPSQMHSSFGPGSQRGTDSLGLMNSSQMNSTFGSPSLGLMHPSQMQSSFGSGSQRGTDSLGLMNSSQMNSTFGSPSLGLMHPSQMHSSFGPSSQRGTDSLGLMNSSQMNSTFGSPSLGLMRSSQMHSSFGPGSQRGNTGDSSSLGLMRSSQMDSSLGPSSFGVTHPSYMRSSGGSQMQSMVRTPNPNVTRPLGNLNVTRPLGNLNVTRPLGNLNVTRPLVNPNATYVGGNPNATYVGGHPNVTHVRQDPNVTHVRTPPFMPLYASTPVSLVYSDSSDFTFPLGSSEYNTSDFITSSPSSNSTSLGLLRSSQMNSTFAPGSYRERIRTTRNITNPNVTHIQDDPNATVQASSLFMPRYISTPVDDSLGVGNPNVTYTSNPRYPHSSGYSADYSGSQLSPRNFADCSTANFTTDISSEFRPPYTSSFQRSQDSNYLSSPGRPHSGASSGYIGDASSDNYLSSADESSRFGGSSRGYGADRSGSPSIFVRNQTSGASSRLGFSSGYSADYSGPQLSPRNFADCSTANFTTDISSEFLPHHVSTPQKHRTSTFVRTQTPDETIEEFTEEESYEDSSMYDSSEDENFSYGKVVGGRSKSPSAVVRKRLFKTTETPSGEISELTIEETSEEEPGEDQFEEPSEMFDSSDERMNDSMMGRVLGGDLGRRLVFPTPPGQPSGTGRVIHLDGNEIRSPDRKTVSFKATNSGVNFLPGPSAAPTMNVTATMRNTTYDPSAFMGQNVPYGVSPPRSISCEPSLESTYLSNLFKESGGYEDFAPAANSSEIDLRGNQTFIANPANPTHDPGAVGFLEELERNEQTQFDANLRDWQSARRRLIFDTTKLSTSAASLHRHTR